MSDTYERIEHTDFVNQRGELGGRIRDDRLQSLGCVVAAANLSVKTKVEVNKTEDVSLGTSLDISDVANVDDGTSVDLGKAEDVNIGGGIGVGLIFAAYMQAVSRQPEAQRVLQPMLFMGFAVVEALAILGFVMFFL